MDAEDRLAVVGSRHPQLKKKKGTSQLDDKFFFFLPPPGTCPVRAAQSGTHSALRGLCPGRRVHAWSYLQSGDAAPYRPPASHHLSGSNEMSGVNCEAARRITPLSTGRLFVTANEENSVLPGSSCTRAQARGKEEVARSH